jgi:hypothetical protein
LSEFNGHAAETNLSSQLQMRYSQTDDFFAVKKSYFIFTVWDFALLLAEVFG